MASDEGHGPRPFSPLPHLIATMVCGVIILITGWLTAIMPDRNGRYTLIGMSAVAAVVVIGWYLWNVTDYVRRYHSYRYRPDQTTMAVVIGMQAAILIGCTAGAFHIFMRVMAKCL
jgi:hypothetical protein